LKNNRKNKNCEIIVDRETMSVGRQKMLPRILSLGRSRGRASYSPIKDELLKDISL